MLDKILKLVPANLTLRLAIFGMILLVLLICGFQAQSLRQGRRLYRERAELSVQTMGRVLAIGISDFFKSADTALRSASQLRREEDLDGKTQSRFNAALMNMGLQMPGLVGLRATDADGNITYASDPSRAIGINVNDRYYFTKLKSDPDAQMIVSRPIMGRVIGKWVIVCARRYTQSDGSFGGILLASITVEAMAERLLGQNFSLGDNGLLNLFGADGDTILRYRGQQQDLQKIGEKLTAPGLRDWFKSDGAPRIIALEGDDITYVQTIPGLPLNLAVGITADAAFAGWRREAETAIISTVSVIAILLVAFMLIYRAVKRRQQANDALADIFTLNQNVVGKSPIGIYVCHQDGRCVASNAAFADILGGREEDVAQINFRDLPSWKTVGATEKAEQAFATGAVQHLEAEFTTLFGKTAWFHAMFAAFTYQNAPHLLIMLRDVTELQLARQHLEESNKKLLALSATDGLTGIANRRHFDEILEVEWRRAARHLQPLTLMMIDVDHFKLYNDCYGHQQGDACLRKVAGVLKEYCSRAGESAARYGGEEFAVIAANTDSSRAGQLAEIIRAEIEALALPHERSSYGLVTVSIGVMVLIPGPGQREDLLIKFADQALYRAKESGRNRLVLGSLDEFSPISP